MDEDTKNAIKAARELEKIFAKGNTTSCSSCSNRFGKHCGADDQIQRGCCSNCAAASGYYYENDSAKILKPLYWWDDVYGFFNPVDLHCNIPRLLRSGICLSYTCGYTSMSERKEKRIDKLIRQIKKQDMCVLIAHITGIEDPYLNYVESLPEVGEDVIIPEYSIRNEDHPDSPDRLYGIDFG